MKILISEIVIQYVVVTFGQQISDTLIDTTPYDIYRLIEQKSFSENLLMKNFLFVSILK